jgi:alpha-galactosidase
MIDILSSTCHLRINNRSYSLNLNQTLREDSFFTTYRSTNNKDGSLRVELTLHVKEAVLLNTLELKINCVENPVKAMLCNGFQTWSGSKYYNVEEDIPKLRKIARPLFKYYGDYYIKSAYINSKHLHSWTYTSLQTQKDLKEIGLSSNNDQLAFTLFSYCKKTDQLIISKELSDFPIKNSFPLFDLNISPEQGISKHKTWDNNHQYPKLNQKSSLQTAWTSWYKYQQNISAKTLHKEIESISEENKPDLFQIDDGYQKHIGDWLEFKEDLSNELKPISKKIASKGMMPGIWLAPFVVEPKSNIFKNHPNWLIKNAKGKPIKVGYNGIWKSWYYGLDIFNKDVQNYLMKVFHILKNEYDFKFFKVDFLFAACVNPPKGTSRAQAMTFGMELLKRATNDCELLSCGVPLAPTFGHCAISRIGPDTHLRWDFKLLKLLKKRERPSNYLALHTVICRYLLKSFSAIDPDVYILRPNNKEENLELSDKQKRTHVILAYLFGDVQFSSDTVALYTKETLDVLKEAKYFQDAKITHLKRLRNDCYRVQTESHTIFINLNDKSKKISFKGQLIPLEAYDTRIFEFNQ